MATTPNYGLKYPTDYAEPADSPAALEDLALSTDTAMVGMEGRVSSKATVFVSSTAPTNPKVGDIWVTP